MDFHYTDEQEAFRRDIRQWLAANLPRELCVDDPTDERVAPDRATFERRVEWQRTMYKAGWVGIKEKWPGAYKAIKNFNLSSDEMNVMVGEVDLDGKEVDAVVADWIAKNEDRGKKWLE